MLVTGTRGIRRAETYNMISKQDAKVRFHRLMRSLTGRTLLFTGTRGIGRTEKFKMISKQYARDASIQ